MTGWAVFFQVTFLRRTGPQYSRLVMIPGCGTGYLPSGPACTGAGESIVSLSTPGAYSWSELSISSNVISLPVWAALRPSELTKLASAPRFTSLNGLSSRIASTRSFHSF